jgi:asparagine synthase (glutamine-hydrolysing)
VIVYNGELYNMDELRRLLAEKGLKAKTSCDTELVLLSYIAFGAQCTRLFNGIFAFVIWDEAAEKFFAARDRIGVKPFFYAEKDGEFIFASEVKSLLLHRKISPNVASCGLAELLMTGPARTPGCGIFQDVKELRAGWQLEGSCDKITARPYWTLESRAHTDSLADTKEKLRLLLEDAVKRQLRADVKVGTFLSGGLDSSALTAIAADIYRCEGKGRLKTFSVDYKENERFFQSNEFQSASDAPWVRKMAEYTESDHTQVLIDNIELAKTLPKAVLARDYPGMADVDTSLYLFSREIKKEATVVLSGECADEIFGGYPWFFRAEMVNADTFPWSPDTTLRLSWFNDALKKKLDLENHVRARYEAALKEVPTYDGDNPKEARLREIFYLSLTRWMPTLLERKDRMSMAFGLEVRVPYCDHRIVEYMWNVPWHMKYDGTREKSLLRHALSGKLPHDVLWRKKSPYPKTYNPEYVKMVRNWAADILQEKDNALREIFDLKTVKNILDSDADMKLPWFGQLMAVPQFFAYIIQLDCWFKKYSVKLV